MTTYAARLLAPVLRDADACAGLRLRVEDHHRPPPGFGPPRDDDTVMIWTPDGGRASVWSGNELPDHELLATVSDRVHEVVIEALWSAGLSTSLPPCPWHPDSHPLGVELRALEAVWACPRTQQVVCAVGRLTC